MDYLLVICTVQPASCHGYFYLLGRSLEKLWEEVGLGGGGGRTSTHKINSREKMTKEIMDMLTKKIMQLKNFPTPSITFLINDPPLIKATISAGLHMTTSW